jgi:hypothetical protein
MGYIIGFIKKLLGIKEVIAGLLLAFQIAYYVALAVFIVKLTTILYDLYQLIQQLFNMSTSGTLAGSAGGNDFNSIVWSMLNAYGILDVFRTFLPLIFSALTIYLTLFATRMLLDYKAKALASLHRAANLFVG